MSAALERVQGAQHFVAVEKLLSQIQAKTILVKGSRGIGTDAVVKRITEEFS